MAKKSKINQLKSDRLAAELLVIESLLSYDPNTTRFAVRIARVWADQTARTSEFHQLASAARQLLASSANSALLLGEFLALCERHRVRLFVR
jgi:hypothetical protein